MMSHACNPRWKQKNHEFKGSLGNIVSPCLKITPHKNPKKSDDSYTSSIVLNFLLACPTAYSATPRGYLSNTSIFIQKQTPYLCLLLHPPVVFSTSVNGRPNPWIHPILDSFTPQPLALKLGQAIIIFHPDCYNGFLVLCLPLLRKVFSIHEGSPWAQGLCTCCPHIYNIPPLAIQIIWSLIQIFAQMLPSQTSFP
jgi:hypothetical protein